MSLFFYTLLILTLFNQLTLSRTVSGSISRTKYRLSAWLSIAGPDNSTIIGLKNFRDMVKAIRPLK